MARPPDARRAPRPGVRSGRWGRGRGSVSRRSLARHRPREALRCATPVTSTPRSSQRYRVASPVGDVERQRCGRPEGQGSLAVGRRELAVVRTDEARASVAVVAGAVLGHGALVDHGRTIHSRSRPVNENDLASRGDVDRLEPQGDLDELPSGRLRRRDQPPRLDEVPRPLRRGRDGDTMSLARSTAWVACSLMASGASPG